MKKRFYSMFLACTMVLSLSACGKRDKETIAEETATNVTVYQVGSDEIEATVTYTGELKASETVGVSAKIGAKATSVYVNEGDRVTAGQVLATLDSKDLQLAYDQVLAAFNSATANYNMIVNSSTKQSAAGAKQNLESAEIAYNTAKTNYDRESQLYAQNSNVKLAEQSYQDAQSGYQRAKELYDQDTALIAAKNALTSAQDNLMRTQKLFDMGAATQVELDAATQSVQNAQANVDAQEASKQSSIDTAYSAMLQAEENLKTVRVTASAAVDAAKNALDQAEFARNTARENISLTETANAESIKTAKAGVASAKANLASAENNLNNTRITAPIDGYIAGKNLNAGQMASPGIELFNIKNSGNINCEINVTESVIPYITQGTPARISVKSAGVENVSGTVTLVNTVKNDATGMYKVQVSIPNPDNTLKVGMFVDVTLVTQQASDSLTIPSEAIMQDGSTLYVYKAHGDTAEKCEIITGIKTDDKTEVLSGLLAGDQIILSGKEYLSEKNNKIKIADE